MKTSSLPYFDQSTGQFYLELQPMRFARLDSSALKLHLRRSGLSKDEYVGSLNQLENAIAVSQIERCLDYVGPLAGHPAGPFQTQDGRRILVTDAPRLPIPKRGKWDRLREFFEQLLGDEVEHAYAWHKCAFESLVKVDFRASQLLALAGPAGCGKSLFQHITTAILGGRVGKPFKFMIGDTHFNGDLACSEHWCIEDEHASTDIRTRRKFGTAIKDVCVNTNLFIHRKGCQAISLPTFRRTTLSVNSEPENIVIIPPLDASLIDKITLVSCSFAEVGSDRKAEWNRFKSEIGHYLHWLINVFEIPRSLRCNRYGVKSYQSPALLEVLSGESAEERLLTLIDEVFFSQNELGAVRMSADNIQSKLLQSQHRFIVEKLLYWPSACGVYLSRLAVSRPARVQSDRESMRRLWVVHPPKRN